MPSIASDLGRTDTLLPVDLRSDTVTRPTQEMYDCMRAAPLGDDGLDFDPSVRALEETVAQMLGKDTGLFVPSCTMANLLAVLSQAQRNQQVVVEANAHMYTSERGSATFTGTFYQAVSGERGMMDLDAFDEAICGGKHKPDTTLVCLETSHNNAGGAVPSLQYMDEIRQRSAARGIRAHLDGARLFNAAVALGVPARKLVEGVDTVSVCLSKGLSAPVGAILAGDFSTLEQARRLRRMLGGTQRQAGVVAAAGLYAVQHMVERLAEDHRRARALSDAINGLGLPLVAAKPDTNIVQVDVSQTGHDSATWVGQLDAVGLQVRPWGRGKLRCVTHRHISDGDLVRAVESFRQAYQGLLGQVAKG